MGSGQSFYNYGYGSWDLTKTILSMKPLKELEKKSNKIASVENSSTKKTSYGAMTNSLVMILKKKFLHMKPLKDVEEK